ncbi:hypothetical protein CBL_02358 [Carabus blaptoides fortunei]
MASIGLPSKVIISDSSAMEKPEDEYNVVVVCISSEIRVKQNIASTVMMDQLIEHHGRQWVVERKSAPDGGDLISETELTASATKLRSHPLRPTSALLAEHKTLPEGSLCQAAPPLHPSTARRLHRDRESERIEKIQPESESGSHTASKYALILEGAGPLAVFPGIVRTLGQRC